MQGYGRDTKTGCRAVQRQESGGSLGDLLGGVGFVDLLSYERGTEKHLSLENGRSWSEHCELGDATGFCHRLPSFSGCCHLNRRCSMVF